MDTEAPTPAADLNLPPAPPKENRFWEHAPGRPKGNQAVRTQITHDAIIDFMLANPTARRQDVAEAFGFKSVASISIILNSDAFQARYAKRQEKLVDPLVVASVEDRIKLLAAKSAENLATAIENFPNDTKLNLEVFKESTRAGAYGVKGPTVAVQTQFVVALPGPASSSAEWMNRFAPSEVGVVRPSLENAPSESGATSGAQATSMAGAVDVETKEI